MFKNVASQKIQVFVFDTATGLGKSGDAANITLYVSKDNGAVTALADTSATEMDATNAKGVYVFDVSQTETNADYNVFTGKSSTSGIGVAPQFIYTRAPNSGLLSIDSNGRVDVIKVAGTTQTARDLGASVLLSTGTGTGQLDFTSGVVKANVTQNAGSAITSASGIQEVKVASTATAAIAAIADGLLDRDMSTGTDSGSTTVRTMRQALRFIRNKWSISGTTLTVCKEDDSTSSWTAALTASAGADPISASDPAGP